MLYALARPLLFRLDPERAHELTLGLADAPLRFGLLRVARAPGAPVRAMGLDFANAVGLAAGERCIQSLPSHSHVSVV